MKYRNEYDYLIHLIRCAIENRVPDSIPKRLSFERVLEYGIIHDVANIAFVSVEKLDNKPDEMIYNRWRQNYWKAVKRDAEQRKAREEILSSLHSCGINTLEVQGTVVKEYYPQSHWRMMSDIDFIVPVDVLDRLENEVRKLGYKTEIVSQGKEIHASKGNIFIEFHTEFFDEIRKGHEILNEPFSYVITDNDFYSKVSDTTFYFFHLLHTIKHATEYMGVGIRRIIDLYYLENALKNKVDYSYIDDVLKKNNLYEVKTKLLAVKDKWFCGIKPKLHLKSFEKEILGAGSQGTEKIHYKNRYRGEKEKGNKYLINYVVKILFPKKEGIYKAYPTCEKYRFPILVCWIYRWIYLFLHPKK